MSKPTNDDILEAMARNGSNGIMTYVLRNVLRRTYPDITVALLRRRLEAMEREGVVRRAPTAYVRQICWAIVPTTPGD